MISELWIIRVRCRVHTSDKEDLLERMNVKVLVIRVRGFSEVMGMEVRNIEGPLLAPVSCSMKERGDEPKG
jgi:hypothetical protein